MAPPLAASGPADEKRRRPPLSPPRASQTMATVENPPAPPVLEPVQPSPELVPSPPREGLIPMPIGAMGMPVPPPMFLRRFGAVPAALRRTGPLSLCGDAAAARGH